MSDGTHGEPSRRRTHTNPMTAPYLEFDLLNELEQLDREPQAKTGHNARILVKNDTLRVVLISLKAHASIPRHQTEGRISIQTLRGHIHVRALERTFNLRRGSLLALDHDVAHDVKAVRDSAFLLTIAWPEACEGRTQ
jgi:quercetin dioxygenase-like cupin family protein